jgi:polyhydroxyalkanoate synthesis repressor PhaR
MARKSANSEGGGPVIIKKYANRRLYNTQSSKYITLDFLAELIRKNVDFQVVDAKSGEDITHSVLTQIIMEEENTGEGMLPVNFLRQIIALYGDSMQGKVPAFLEGAMDSFRKNQKQFQSVVEDALTAGPFGELAKQNLQMIRAAREAFVPTFGGAAKDAEAASGPAPDNADELDDLKRQMEVLKARIDKLSSQ